MQILKQIFNLIQQAFLFLFLLIFIPVCPTTAQQVKFNKVSHPEGSFSGIINGISQDPFGYMWFAVFDRGLYRSDGYHLVAYQNDPLNPVSLATNATELVYADHKGIIWVGTHTSGLDRLDPNTGIFTHFPHRANDMGSISDNDVKAIYEDHEGTLWVGTVNGLNRLDQKTGTFTRYLHNQNDTNTLSWPQVQVIYEDRQHTLWVGTANFLKEKNMSAKEGGLNRFDRKTGKFTRFLNNPQDPFSLIDNRVGAILEDSKANFWVCTAGDGLHLMNRETGKFKRLRYDPSHPGNLSGPPRKKNIDLDMDLFFIQEDGAGAVWFGASGGWITSYDPTTKKVNHYDSFNDDDQAMQAVSGALTSRDGILWITTWMGDVYRVDPFHTSIPHFKIGSVVHAIHEDLSGTLWIGTLGKGLIRIDRSTRKKQQFMTGSKSPYNLSDGWIIAIYGGDDSTLWIGSLNHLNRYNRKTQIFTQYENDPQDETSLSKGWVAAIEADEPGSLWIAMEQGLDHLDIKTEIFTHYRNDPKDSTSISHNFVTSLLKDRSGDLWAGTRYGVLNLFDPQTKKFKRFPCGGEIGSIVEDSDNIIWVGTSNGLYRSNPAVDSFSLFTDPGFIMTPNTMITGILEDDQKNLWVASSAGIFRFGANRKEITLYKQNHGVDPSGLSSALMRGKKGRRGELFFGDRTGYYAYFPDQFRTNTTAPQIVINDFRLANQPVKPGKGSLLDLSISQTKIIRLKYNQNFFSFDFSGIHYSSPEDNQHLFMLEDLDNTWKKAGTEKTAYYYNVPPGRYIFRVKAASSNGIWAEKSIVLIITPPWWTRLWFRIALIFCLAALFYALIRWRLHQRFRSRLERSEKEKQLANLRHKTAELEMQALRAQMNPHFIFNSLNSINMFILENNKLQASEYLSKFSRLVRLILQNSQEAFIPLDRELEALGLYLELESLRFEQRFEYKISMNDEVDTTMLKVPPLIIQPYAENAIWHGLMHKRAKGHLEIELYLKEKILFCKITDDGIGRTRAAEFKSKSSLTYKSMGMRITADRIAMFQQQERNDNFISVKDLVDPDNLPAGTEIVIKVPVRYD